MENMEKADLLKAWLKAKKAEQKAHANRMDIESNIIRLFGTDFQEQSKTFKEGNFSINIKKNIVHKLDQDAWLSVRPEIQEELRPEKIKFELDVKGFEFLKINHKDIYLKISDCVTISKNKPSIKVEKI